MKRLTIDLVSDKDPIVTLCREPIGLGEETGATILADTLDSVGQTARRRQGRITARRGFICRAHCNVAKTSRGG